MYVIKQFEIFWSQWQLVVAFRRQVNCDQNEIDMVGNISQIVLIF